ncbi:putative F-box domain-containing protein [Rosa chinensis]|uniref:Putative F-box domain-containing protein n=1 Tax=Rosa chinensis TaxID=74649 RepID=A0A2P6SNW5_ROSCH|nr:putative F-box domain-containing protein [Rosa chinensis]
MRGGATNRKRSCTNTFPSSASGHHSKRLKTSSAASTRRRASSKSKFTDTTIDDLPDVVLVDILCRLPCYDYVCEYKCVSKRWSNLMSDPYFIGRFLLRRQSEHMQTPPIPLLTLVNQKGESFPTTMSSSSPSFLTRVFKRLMSSFSLKKQPIVVGTYNDLVLCCATEYFQRDYFICNPYTTQWVALPPTSRVLRQVPVGFICDPYCTFYKKGKDDVHHQNEQTSKRSSSSTTSTIIDDGHGQLVNINAGFRCKVVRILPFDDTFEYDTSSEFKIEIFSFEIGEWRESIISFPHKFCYDQINPDFHWACNGMLYWSGYLDFVIGLNPFVINFGHKNSTSSKTSNHSGDDHYECCFMTIVKDPANYRYNTECLFARGGCLQRMCGLSRTMYSSILCWVSESKKEEDDRIVANRAWSREFNTRRHRPQVVGLIGFDPNDENVFYYSVNGKIFEHNILTRMKSRRKMAPGESINNYCFFPLTVFPWWPTPVPRMPEQLAS